MALLIDIPFTLAPKNNQSVQGGLILCPLIIFFLDILKNFIYKIKTDLLLTTNRRPLGAALLALFQV
jgi:hypothetical protein